HNRPPRMTNDRHGGHPRYHEFEYGHTTELRQTISETCRSRVSSKPLGPLGPASAARDSISALRAATRLLNAALLSSTTSISKPANIPPEKLISAPTGTSTR